MFLCRVTYVRCIWNVRDNLLFDRIGKDKLRCFFFCVCFYDIPGYIDREPLIGTPRDKALVGTTLVLRAYL